MRERRHVTRRSLPGQLLLAVVLIVAMAVAGCSPSVDEGPSPDKVAKAKLLSALAGAAPREATGTVVPLALTPPDAAPSPQPATMPPASPPPTPTATTDRGTTDPATVVAAAPFHLRIPSIGVDSGLMDLGLQADGTLEVPPSGFPAGWYTGSPTPGELGPAIIAGHVDWDGRAGVFFDLRDLSPGDAIAVTRRDGSTARFRVTQVEQFDKDAFPTQAVYGDLDHAGLRLITCAGAFDPTMRSYDDNLVVFAELVEIAPA